MAWRRSLFAAALALGLGSPALAEDAFPARPVQIIVGFSPGAGIDLLARFAAEKLGPAWSQRILVENKTGAAGNLASDFVVKSAADGHTLLLGHSSLVPTWYMVKDTPFQPQKDLVPVGFLATLPMIVSVRKDLPVRSMAELIAHLRANPGKISFGHAGIGTPFHLANEMLASATGTKIVEVPYRGMAPALADLAGGALDVALLTPVSARAHFETGQIIPLAVTTRERLPDFPNLPTISETVIPGFHADMWYGLFAPARTPQATLLKINADLNAAMAAPEASGRLKELGYIPATKSLADFDALYQGEARMWDEFFKQHPELTK